MLYEVITLIFVIANIVYPVIYSVAYNGEQIKKLDIAFVDMDNTASSRQMRRMIDATEGLNIAYEPGSLDEAKQLFYESKVKGVVSIFRDHGYRRLRTRARLKFVLKAWRNNFV